MKLSNRFLGILATAATIAAVVIPVLLYLLQVTTKSLTCFVISESRIVNIEELGLPDIAMTYKGESISRLHAAKIEIRNSGNIPIIRQDFERNAYIDFGQEARVIWAEVTNQSPDNLRPTIEVQDNRILLKPTLLNPGDRYTVEILVRGKYKAPMVDARIRGIKDVELISAPHGSGSRVRAVYLLFLGLIIIGIYGYFGGLTNPMILLKSQYISIRDIAGGLVIVIFSGIASVICSLIFVIEVNLRGAYLWVAMLGTTGYLLGFYLMGNRKRRALQGLIELYKEGKGNKEAQQEDALDETKVAPSHRE